MVESGRDILPPRTITPMASYVIGKFPMYRQIILRDLVRIGSGPIARRSKVLCHVYARLIAVGVPTVVEQPREHRPIGRTAIIYRGARVMQDAAHSQSAVRSVRRRRLIARGQLAGCRSIVSPEHPDHKWMSSLAVTRYLACPSPACTIWDNALPICSHALTRLGAKHRSKREFQLG